MTTDLVAGLREYVEARREWLSLGTSKVEEQSAEELRYGKALDWMVSHASTIADEMEALKRKADAFDLFMSCVDAVKDAEPSDVVNALLDKVKENSRLRAENERLFKVDSEAACATDCLNTWCRENYVAECKDYAKDFCLRDTIDGLVDKINSERNRLRAEVERLKEVGRKVLDHYLKQCYDCDGIPEEAWDDTETARAMFSAALDAKGGG